MRNIRKKIDEHQKIILMTQKEMGTKEMGNGDGASKLQNKIVKFTQNLI